MQTKDPAVCLQCQKPSLTASNRLVQDTCGHQKCRSCLLEDAESCKQCLLDPPAQNGDTAETDGIQHQNPVLQVTDNHTAVIHCNGKAKSYPRMVSDDSNKSSFDRENGKQRNVSKKKIIQIPSHVTMKSDPLSYLCTICNKSFVTKSHIKYHNYCTGELKPYKCDICSKEFILKVQLQIHMCKHTNEKPFKCHTCSRSFTEKSKLTRHMVLHSAGKKFICPDCAKSFKTKESLRIHSMIHRNEKPFACKLCSARFNNSSNLKKHLVSHSNEKVHMCDQCGRRFKLKWALSQHRKSHLNLRPHSCNLCSRSFLNLKDLQRHALIHQDTKGYSCSICLTSFRRKDNLHRHMKNTHPGKKGGIIITTIPSDVSDCPKKSVVIENPNAVNVITASPAAVAATITKHTSNGTTADHLPTAISTDSRPTGSVINVPIKLAFKTPAFKSHYNIERGSELLPNAEIPKTFTLVNSSDLETISTAQCSSGSTNSFTYMRSGPVLEDNPPPKPAPVPQSLSSYTSVLHYETSFQNRKHAMIKNIKFKVPERYTNSFKVAASSSNVTTVTDDARATEVNCSVIVNNSDVHWRRRTSQNLGLKN